MTTSRASCSMSTARCPRVTAPDPADDERFDRSVAGVNAHLLAGARDERPDVALLQVVGGNRIEHRLAQLVDRIPAVHAVDLRRVGQSPHVLAQAEDRAAGGGFVAADALKDG